MIPILIQARMSSKRLPNKMLMDINGSTLIDHVYRRCAAARLGSSVTILTSKHETDDRLASYCAEAKYPFYRGNLNNVHSRFTNYLSKFKPTAFVRISGDSPFISPRLIDIAIQIFKDNQVDLVSNVRPRKFPSGQSVEVISTTAFTSCKHQNSTNFSAEHVTSGLYDSPFVKLHFSLPSVPLSDKLSIDTSRDYKKAKSLIFEDHDKIYPTNIEEYIIK